MPLDAPRPRARPHRRERQVLTDELVDNENSVIFLNAQVKDEWTELSSTVPVFHISQRILAELETVTSIPINAYLVGKAQCRFAIAIDYAIGGESADLPLGSAKTEVLLLNGQRKTWRFYERSRLAWPYASHGAQVVGAIWGLRKKMYGSLWSDALGYWSGDNFCAWHVTKEQTERTIRTLLALLWLIQHEEVTVSEVAVLNGQQHSIVTVPETLEVSAAIADLLAGKHVRKQPSRLNNLARALVLQVKDYASGTAKRKSR